METPGGSSSGGARHDIHEAVEKLPRIGWGESFRFRCHSGLSCWTSCCKNPNLFLTPYDVLRLKNRLGVKSFEFLASHTVTGLDEYIGLPVVLMKMGADGSCPYVSAGGCSVYSDRPTACRIYPLGQGASSGANGKPGERMFFKVEEEHCLGWKEDKQWRLEEWVLDQGANEYNAHNEIMARLAFHPSLGEPGALDERKAGMIHLAFYDLDRFRQFVFDTSFLQKFAIEPETVENIRNNDGDLLKFAVRWVEFSVLGIPVIEPVS